MMDYQKPVSAIHASVNDENYSHQFTKTADTAQYKGSDYSGVVRIARGISLSEAFSIAESDPQVDYFVYVKGLGMVLEIPADVQFDSMNDRFALVSHQNYVKDSDGQVAKGLCRIFNYGDVIFFKNDGKWLGSAPGLADTYSKK